jgi:hypothetical protein
VTYLILFLLGVLGTLGAISFRRLRAARAQVMLLLEERQAWHEERAAMARELIWWRAAAHISDELRALVDLRLAWRGLPPVPPPRGFGEVPLLLAAKAGKPGQS